MTCNNVISAFLASRHCLSVSHLSFANDIVIFTRGDRHSLKRLMDFLDLYIWHLTDITFLSLQE